QAEFDLTFKRRCREMAANYGGTILNADSNTLQICFGYPVAQEDAARRAVHASLDIRDLLRAGTAEARRVTPNCWLSAHSGTVVVREDEQGKVVVTGEPPT